jgi:L-fuconolactonase
MIGSDWPVCKLAGEYKDVLDMPKQYYSTFDEDEKEQIFRLNCAEFYKLEL